MTRVQPGAPVERAAAHLRAERRRAQVRPRLFIGWRTRTLLQRREAGTATEADLLRLRALLEESRRRSARCAT